MRANWSGKVRANSRGTEAEMVVARPEDER